MRCSKFLVTLRNARGELIWSGAFRASTMALARAAIWRRLVQLGLQGYKIQVA